MSSKGANTATAGDEVIESLLEGKTPEGWIEVSGMPGPFESDLERMFINEGEGTNLACLQIKPMVAVIRSVISQMGDILDAAEGNVRESIGDSIECITDGLDCIEAVCIHSMEDPLGYGDGDVQ